MPRAPSAWPIAAGSPPGLRAGLAVWDVAEPAELAYRIAVNPLHSRWFEGQEWTR